MPTTEPPFEVVHPGTPDRPPTRREWVEARQSGISASEVSAVMGRSRFKSALDVFIEKLGSADLDEDDQTGEHLEHGHGLEGYVLRCFEDRTGMEVRRSSAVLRSRAHPWLLATPDGFVGPGPDWAPIDAKTTGTLAAWDEGVPEYVMLQLQTQMLVTARPRAFVAVLAGGLQGMAFRWREVPADPELQGELLEATRAFWERVEAGGPPPDPDGSKRASEALKRLYPEDNGETVELPGSLTDVAVELVALREDQRSLDNRRRELENCLKAALGEAEAGMLPNGVRVSWRLQVAKRKAQPAREVRSRVFRIKETKP